MAKHRRALIGGLGLWLGSLTLVGSLVARPALAQDRAPVRHALVIGANDGGGTLQPLRYAERDAEQIVDVLTELGGFREDRVTVLYQPDRATVQAALAHHAALAEAAPDDLFVLYYSGHADAQGLRLGPETYWFESLKHDLRNINSTARLGVLDACRSGTIVRLKGAKVAPSLFAGQDRLAASGEVWLTATSADEVAQESESLRGGFFTHYLVSGLRGAADTGDGLVDVDELRAYTYAKVVARSGQAGATQRPHFDVNLSGSDGLALTDVRRADATLILDQGGPGHVSILRVADRTQLAEVDVSADRDVRLALPAGRYLVRRRDLKGELWETQVALSSSMPVEVTDWRSVTAEVAAARGDSKLDTFQNRVRHYRSQSQGFVEDLNLGESPTVAGSLSVLVPGGGQLYNRETPKAIAYFLGTASLIGGATVFSLGKDDVRGGGAAAALGVAIWGASIADAAQNVRRLERHRPRTGAAVGWSTGFIDEKRALTGLMVEFTPVENLSLGLDRAGYTRHGGGGWDVNLGSRLIFALEGERFRPGVFISYGLRLGREGVDTPADLGDGLNLVPSSAPPLVLRGVMGGGLMVRYHVTTRYFIELDARVERDGDLTNGVAGIGMGVLVGKNKTEPPKRLRGQRRDEREGE